jgi:hypothetical protein
MTEKTATDVLLPLALIGAAVGGYFFYKQMKDNKRRKDSGRADKILDEGFSLGGKRRRTHRHRR